MGVKNLIGQRFGSLEVIGPVVRKNKRTYWHCKCDCGKEKDIWAAALVSKRTKTCGCCNDKEVHSNSFIDISGQLFGRLTALSYNQITKKWLCQCSCGKKKEVLAAHLKNGTTVSCGCINRDSRAKDLTNMTFGKWKVLERDYTVHNGAYWKCQCECGVIKTVCGSTLIRGLSKSCGCRKADTTRAWCLQDLTGRSFGNLRVMYQVANKGRYVAWHCKCICGNEIDVAAGHLQSGHTKSCGCNYVYHRGSMAEIEIKNYIESIFGKKFEKIRILDGKEIDMYNDELKIGIEYNGSAFHATTNNIYRNKPKNYHQQKFLLAKEKGIHLINIFDVDYEQNRNKILAYLKDIISPKFRLYARKCQLLPVDKEIAWDFYSKYHLQGKSYMSQINYGLYDNNELVACMGFGKLRMKNASKEDYYELHRYCVKHQYSVIGGAEKLFKAFIKDYSPQYIKSYSENNYFLGGMYGKLGFIYTGQSSIPYFWVLKDKKLKREQCQVKKLKVVYPDLYQRALEESASNKEDYIMSSLGAYKVYTAGNSIWEWISIDNCP